MRSAMISDGVFFGGFELTMCLGYPQTCTTHRGVFKTTGATGWQQVVDGSADVEMAASGGNLYWVDTARGSQDIHRTTGDASVSTVEGSTRTEDEVSGLAIAGGGLFTLTTVDSRVTTLSRRDSREDGSLGPAADLLQVNGWAGLLKSYGSRLAWGEGNNTFVVSDPSGRTEHIVELPPSTVFHAPNLGDDYLIVSFETTRAGWRLLPRSKNRARTTHHSSRRGAGLRDGSQFNARVLESVVRQLLRSGLEHAGGRGHATPDSLWRHRPSLGCRRRVNLLDQRRAKSPQRCEPLKNTFRPARPASSPLT